MDSKRLFQPLLILGAFGLGLVLGFALFGLGGWGEATAGSAVYLLLAILGVGFGLVGLVIGAVAQAPEGAWRLERSSADPAAEPGASGLRMNHRPQASEARSTVSPPEDRRLGGRLAHGASVPEEPSAQRNRSAVASEAPSTARVHRPVEQPWSDSGERTSGPSPVDRGKQSPSAPERSPDTEARRAAELELGRTGNTPSSGGSTAAPAPEPVGFRPEDLIRVWEAYEAEGEGHFTADGLARGLDAAGIEARALSGEELGAGDAVLGVAALRGNGPIYVLPDFNRPSSAVSRWFEDQGSGVRTAAIKRLDKVAEVERRGGELVVLRKGVVA